MGYFTTTPRPGAFRAAILFIVIAISLSAVRPLWVDEILQLIETRKASPAAMIIDIQRIPGAVPLGFLVQQAGLRITGYSLARARWTPVLFGGASLYVVILLAAEAGLVRPWLAGALFAAFPLTLRYATESRVYSQALFFSVLATFLHLRLSKRPTWWIAVGCFLALTAAVYTQPYAGLVGAAHVLWSVLRRNGKSAVLSAAALLFAGAAFLPWLLWSRSAWAASIASSAIHFHISAAMPLMIFRESIGAGYWGAGCLVLLCGMAVRKRLPRQPAASLFVVIPLTVALGVLAADARFHYFLAARQFLWILPSLAILAAMAIERAERMALVLAGVLVFVCCLQSSRFFLRPREDWQSAADAILEQVHRGARFVAIPSEQATLYTFFHPELRDAGGSANRIVMAITPLAAGGSGQNAVAAYLQAGYEVEQERSIGGSRIVILCRPGH